VAAEEKSKKNKDVTGQPKSSIKKKAKKPVPVFDGPEVKAFAKYIRTAPRKLRLVADMIRGRKANEAAALLNFTTKRAAITLGKVLKSAVANAENNFSLDAGKLIVTQVYIDQGPMLKRWIPRSRGRATSVFKYSSHITVAVQQRQEGI
jgi:large subunit ribosomal protein L22